MYTLAASVHTHSANIAERAKERRKKRDQIRLACESSAESASIEVKIRVHVFHKIARIVPKRKLFFLLLGKSSSESGANKMFDWLSRLLNIFMFFWFEKSDDIDHQLLRSSSFRNHRFECAKDMKSVVDMALLKSHQCHHKQKLFCHNSVAYNSNIMRIAKYVFVCVQCSYLNKMPMLYTAWNSMRENCIQNAYKLHSHILWHMDKNFVYGNQSTPFPPQNFLFGNILFRRFSTQVPHAELRRLFEFSKVFCTIFHILCFSARNSFFCSLNNYFGFKLFQSNKVAINFLK